MAFPSCFELTDVFILILLSPLDVRGLPLGVGEWMGEEYCGFYTVVTVGLEGLVCVCVNAI